MIQVRISPHELAVLPGQKKNQFEKSATPRDSEQYILHRLRNAGIPVQGVTFLVALERGELTVRREPDGAYLYSWRERL